jgi:gamma-glutamyl hydrolase
MSKQFLVATAILLALAAHAASLNLKPVIGIYTEPSDYKGYPSSQYSYISASYVKYVEMAGAQVVPIFYDANQAYYDEIFSSINGILFPGGSVGLTKGQPFADNAQYLINKAMDANDRGVFFPVWGTCLGWELLATVVSNFDASVLSPIEDEGGVTHPIKFVGSGAVTDAMPDYLRLVSETEPVWYFNHEWCVVPATFTSIPALGEFFNLLATAQNDQGVTFVSLAEAKEYPIFGSQFHPEKNNFEWRVPANHDANAIMSSEYLANFLVQQSRKNNQQYATSDALQAALIYNYKTVVLPPGECSFSEVYMLPNWSAKAAHSAQFLPTVETLLPQARETLEY